MAVAASGTLSLSFQNLENLVANCATFQTWCGAGSAAEAKANIHYRAVVDPASNRPLCVIIPNHWRALKVAETTFSPDHQWTLLFEANVPALYQSGHEDAFIVFCNYLGNIFEEMQTLAASGDYLPVSELTVIGDSVRRSVWENDANAGDEDDAGDGDYYQGEISVVRRI